MLLERSLGLTRILVLLQIFSAIAIMLFVFASLSALVYQEGFASDVYARYMLLFICSMVVEVLTRPYRLQNLYTTTPRQRGALTNRQILFPFAVLLATMVLLKDSTLSRAFLLTFGLLYSAMIYLSNRKILKTLSQMFYSQSKGGVKPVILIANQGDADRFARRVDQGEFVGIEVAGHLQIGGKSGQETGRVPLLGSLDDLETVCKNVNIGGIVVVNYHEHEDSFDGISKFCQNRSIRFLVLDNVLDRLGQDYSCFSLGTSNVYVPIPEPLEDPVNQMMKRAVDIGVSLVALVGVFPFAAVYVFTIQRLFSPGPLFFKQDRSGKDGELFQIFKFRTMTVSNPDQSVQATKNDCRLYRGAGFLRKASIDELPQFINVLLGHMSVVGPRPHYISHDESFKEVAKSYPVRHFTKPGITGLAQVKGCRGEIKRPADIRARVSWDIEYIRSWSVMLDLKIILMTFRETVLPSERAY